MFPQPTSLNAEEKSNARSLFHQFVDYPIRSDLVFPIILGNEVLLAKPQAGRRKGVYALGNKFLGSSRQAYMQ